MWKILFDSIALRAKTDPIFALITLVLLLLNVTLLIDVLLGWAYDFTNLILLGGAAVGGGVAARSLWKRIFKKH